ncbi:hypothetical protein [Streptomyces sp. NPDC048155]|uniref:hypothetical protein n=1 Tax=Streptomyces sp. NPDC048155 TaxID=3154818 RepID=UPI0033D18E2A
MAHLAQHARRDALPAHLRTCQCHARGCRWHPRHRGCAGGILLVLAWERGGRQWRLADTCAACAGATEHAAVVPDNAPHSAPSAFPSRRRRPNGLAEEVRVREMLSYLSVVLPSGASAAARLLALQCALRSTCSGDVRIPTGLVRGMRLGSDAAPHQALESAGWLCLQAVQPERRQRGFAAQLLDPTVRTQAPGRHSRARAADWALRVCAGRQLRLLGTAPRLLALVLGAHLTVDSAHAAVDQDMLGRLSGLALPQLHKFLDLLVDTRFLRSWTFEAVSGDVRWALSSSPDPLAR